MVASSSSIFMSASTLMMVPVTRLSFLRVITTLCPRIDCNRINKDFTDLAISLAVDLSIVLENQCNTYNK